MAKKTAFKRNGYGEADAHYNNTAPKRSGFDLSEREDMWLRTEGKGTPGGYAAMGDTSIQGILKTSNRGETFNPDMGLDLKKNPYSKDSGSMYGSTATEADIKWSGNDSEANKRNKNAR